MSYQSFGKGQVLTDRMTGLAVHDVMGKVVYCEGAWNCGTNIDKFRASIIALYSLYPDLRGAYVPECKECVEMSTFNRTEATYMPCPYHTTGARVRTLGNSYENADVEKHGKAMKVRLSDYVTRGNIQLMPSEVRRLRTILLSENSLRGLQFWVMIILGIKMYLRVGELILLKVEDFEKDLMMLSSDRCYVAVLAVKVLGKGETVPDWLSIFSDDDFPELCPVTVLLLYISLSGIKSGYIFPAHIPNADSPVECTVHYPYNLFLKKMKHLVSDQLGRELGPTDIFGTHLLRKTGYLFAIFGILRQYGGEAQQLSNLLMANVLKSARHKTVLNAMYYMKDAMTRYEWDRAKRVSTETDVGDFKAIFMSNVDNYRRSTVEYRTRQQDLPAVAAHYLHLVLKFPVEVSVADAVDRAFLPSMVHDSPQESFLKATLSPQQWESYKQLGSSDGSSLGDSLKYWGHIQVVAPTLPVALVIPKSVASKGTYVHPLKSHLKSKSVRECIVLYKKMYDDDLGKQAQFSPTYKTLWYTKVTKVSMCLEKCFEGVVEAMADKVEKLPSRGKYICCLSSACTST
jgi:hypothetical protein